MFQNSDPRLVTLTSFARRSSFATFWVRLGILEVTFATVGPSWAG